jgi:hypothetical protein
MYHININAVRSDALFVSSLQPSEDPDSEQVRQAITRVVRQLRSRGCAALVAYEFGEHPELAVARIRWSQEKVNEVFGVHPQRHSCATPGPTLHAASAA